jgi:hypothetical protein
MKVFSESEIMSSSFHIGVSVNIRGKRRYTNPVIIRYRQMSAVELELLTDLMLKYVKKKPKESRSKRSDPSIKKVQRKKSVRQQKGKRRI